MNTKLQVPNWLRGIPRGSWMHMIFLLVLVVILTSGRMSLSITTEALASARMAQDGVCGLMGRVLLQGRNDHGGSTIRIDGNPAIITASDGQFTFDNLAAGFYSVNASHPGYLPSEGNTIQCQAGQVMQMPEMTLVGGDANNDGEIDQYDLAIIDSAYSTCASDDGFNARADINGSGCVDIYDVVLASTNLGKTAGLVCDEEDNGDLSCRAEDEGVTVRVPWQGREVRVEKHPLGTLEDLRSEDDAFSPNRLVINFEVVEVETGETVTGFQPPIELEVEYTAEDYASAYGNLVLGFWDGARWIAFTPTKYGYELDGSPDGGVGIASISGWGDPPIAYGASE